MPVALPNDIENETPADAVEVEQNFNVLEQYTNTSVITRDGTVAMAAPLQLFGNPVGDDDAVRKAYVDALLPVGIMLPFGGVAVPAGNWAFCNGASVQTAVWPKLFQVIGYRFGGSGGSFLLPDFRNRLPIGLGTDARFNAVGKAGGSWDVPIPYHRHGIDHNHVAKDTSSVTLNIADAGSHNHNIGSDSGDLGSEPTALARGVTRQHVGVAAIDPAGFHGHPLTPNPHKHTVDLQLIDAWSAYAGTSGVDFVPPYLTINFVIRVG